MGSGACPFNLEWRECYYDHPLYKSVYIPGAARGAADIRRLLLHSEAGGKCDGAGRQHSAFCDAERSGKCRAKHGAIAVRARSGIGAKRDAGSCVDARCVGVIGIH